MEESLPSGLKTVANGRISGISSSLANAQKLIVQLKEKIRGVLLSKEEKTNIDIIFEKINSFPEIKLSIIFEIVTQLINLTNTSYSNVQIKDICKMYLHF